MSLECQTHFQCDSRAFQLPQLQATRELQSERRDYVAINIFDYISPGIHCMPESWDNSSIDDESETN